jgi:hypothetical protein
LRGDGIRCLATLSMPDEFVIRVLPRNAMAQGCCGELTAPAA